MFLLKNVAKHLVHNCEKFQVVSNNIELIDSKVPKVSHFQKGGAYDFVGRRKKGPKNPAFFGKSMKNRMSSNCCSSLNFDARIILKVSA